MRSGTPRPASTRPARTRLARAALLAALSAGTGCGGGSGELPADWLAFVADGRLAKTFEVCLVVPGFTPTVVSGPLVAGSSCGTLTWSPDRTRLAFVSNRDDLGQGSDLFVLDPGTGALLNRTLDLPGAVMSCVWSPDSTQLAFVLLHPLLPVRELYSVDACAGAPVLLSLAGPIQDSQSVQVQWQPGATGPAAVLAYRGDPEVPFRRDLYTVAADGSSHQRVNPRGPGVDPSAAVTQFAWSPSGQALAYLYDPLPLATRLYGVVGGVTTELTGMAGANQSAKAMHWSPASDRISFIANRANPLAADLYTVRPDGTDLVTLTMLAGGQEVSYAEWSPAGDLLAYAAFTGNAAADNYALHLVSSQGGGNTVVHAHSAVTALWAPDGTRLATAADGFAPNQLQESLRVFLVPVVGAEVELTSAFALDPGVDAGPTMFWGPGGRDLLFHVHPLAPASPALFSAPVSGGPVVRLVPEGEVVPYLGTGAAPFSGSGDWVAYAPEDGQPLDGFPLRMVPTRGGAVIDVLASFPAGTQAKLYAWR